MATPLTFGYILPLDLMYLSLLPAFRKGFSILPPPAPTPIVALADESTNMLLPEGNFTTVYSPLGERLLQTSLRPLRTFLRHHSGPLCCILWSLPEFWKEAKHSLLQEEPSGPA